MATELSDKTSTGDWSVRVNREPETHSSEIPKAKPAVKPNVVAKPTAAKHADGGRAMTIPTDAAPPAEPAAPASGSWSVTVNHEPPAKKKAAPHIRRETPAEAVPQAHVKIRPKTSSEATSEAPAAPLKPSPAKIPLVPILLCVGILLLAGTLFAKHRKHVRIAEQQTTKAYAAVNTFISRGSALAREAPTHQQKLEAPIQELQAALKTSSSGKAFSECVERAITTVKAVEKSVLDADTGEEQARQALPVLAQKPDYGSLAQKVEATCADCKKVQESVDSRCQALRKLIMAANQRMPTDRKR